MSELSNALGGAAPKHKITTPDGKTYPVSLITQGVKVAFEKELFRRTRQAMAQIKTIVDKDYYERKMDTLIVQNEEGGFAIESEFGRKALTKPGGAMLLLSLLMGTPSKNDPTDIDPMPDMLLYSIIAQAPDEVSAIFRTVTKESFPGVDIDKLEKEVIAQEAANQQQEAADPKAQRSPVSSPSG